MAGSSSQQPPRGNPPVGPTESQAGPQVRLVGGDRVAVEFTIEDLVARALSSEAIDAPIPGCRGCHGCSDY
jgi:hypothetical protein